VNVKEKIFQLTILLDEIDDYSNTLSDALSNVDLKICDLMHLIESETLKTNQSYRVMRELKKLRIERRKIKNDMELLKVYRDNNRKLLNKDSRQFLCSDIGKRDKSLNGKYNNRVYTEEEIKELIGV